MGMSPGGQKRKVTAHLLQGLESQFIHNLTLLGPGYGFATMSNQHDGLVTRGSVPQDAIEAAAAVSDINLLEFVEKSFV